MDEDLVAYLEKKIKNLEEELGKKSEAFEECIESSIKLVHENIELEALLAQSKDEGTRLKAERDHWKANHDNQVEMKNEVAETRFVAMTKQIGELLSENRKLKTELDAAPKWLPVDEFQNDSKFHIVWDADEEDVFDAKMQKRSGKWLAAYATERSLNVTHVLANLRPPVTRQWPLPDDPRGDGDLEPVVADTEVADAIAECRHENVRAVLRTPYDSWSRECADCGKDVRPVAAVGQVIEG